MDKPIRILHVLGLLNIGGAENRIMDIYRNIDRTKVQFDFVMHTNNDCYYCEEIRSLGGRIYSIPRFRIYNYFSYKKAWRDLFKAHVDEKGDSEFKMVHGHMTSTAAIYLPIAKENGVKTTIAHARSAGVDAGIKGIATRILRKNLYKKADRLFTCSNIAAISVFGNKAVEEGKVKFIPNAIDCDKYIYDENIRNELREELGLKDRFVVGHVGRFHYAKNHEYLLKIFRDFLEDWNAQDEKKIDKPALVMLGDGAKMDEMRALALELGISKYVYFLGNKKNIWDYYNIMDYFCYPSRYEGLPGAVVEAQAAGVPVIMSDAICDEVCVTNLIKNKPISQFPDDWAREMLEDAEKRLNNSINDRVYYNEEVKKAGFDIEKQVQNMEEFYLDDNN